MLICIFISNEDDLLDYFKVYFDKFFFNVKKAFLKINIKYNLILLFRNDEFLIFEILLFLSSLLLSYKEKNYRSFLNLKDYIG